MSETGFKGLGIRAKTLLALALTLGFGIAVLVLTLRVFLLNGFLRSEEQEMAQALQSVAGRIAVLLDDLAATAADTAAAVDVRRIDSGSAPGAFRERFAGARIGERSASRSRRSWIPGVHPSSSARSVRHPRRSPRCRRRCWRTCATTPRCSPGTAAPTASRASSRPGPRRCCLFRARSAATPRVPIAGRCCSGGISRRGLMLRLATSGGVPELIRADAGSAHAVEMRDALAALSAGDNGLYPAPERADHDRLRAAAGHRRPAGFRAAADAGPQPATPTAC